MTVFPLTVHPVLELTLGLVEGPVGRRVRGLGGPLVGGSAADEDFATGKPDVDGDAVMIPVGLMVASQLDHDVARRDAVRKTDSKDRGKVMEWIEWAERQADRIDPSKLCPPSLVDNKEKVIRQLQAAEGWWWAKSVPEAKSETDPSAD